MNAAPRTPLLVLECGGFRVGVELDSAIGLTTVEAGAAARPGESGVVVARVARGGESIPVADLGLILGTGPTPPSARALLVRANDSRTVGIRADDRCEAVVSSGPTERLPEGVTELGDDFFRGIAKVEGTDVFVLDPAALGGLILAAEVGA